MLALELEPGHYLMLVPALDQSVEWAQDLGHQRGLGQEVAADLELELVLAQEYQSVLDLEQV